jgi:hypothetical protein
MMAARLHLRSTSFVVLLCFLFATMNGSGGAFSNPLSAAFAAAPAGADSNNSNEMSSDAVPLLPAADPNSKLPSLKFGETLSFEEMGPIILNADGTTRRISNWDQMTPQEQQTTWRRIKKRNEERRNKLLQDQQQHEVEVSKKDEEL